jgi:hypothetical protein
MIIDVLGGKFKRGVRREEITTKRAKGADMNKTEY